MWKSPMVSLDHTTFSVSWMLSSGPLKNRSVKLAGLPVFENLMLSAVWYSLCLVLDCPDIHQREASEYSSGAVYSSYRIKENTFAYWLFGTFVLNSKRSIGTHIGILSFQFSTSRTNLVPIQPLEPSFSITNICYSSFMVLSCGLDMIPFPVVALQYWNRTFRMYWWFANKTSLFLSKMASIDFWRFQVQGYKVSLGVFSEIASGVDMVFLFSYPL